MPAEFQSITLETIDGAIHDWFDQTVDVHVETPNGERKKVPVQFSAGERAITSRQKKGIRDKNGVLILPLINVHRTVFDPSPDMQALGTETEKLQIARLISGETNNLRNLNQDRSPAFRSATPPVVYEVTTIPFPARSILNYRVSVQTQYMIQMNTVLEKIINQLDLHRSFVATFNPRKHPPIGENFDEREQLNEGYVVGFFEETLNDAGNLQEFTDQERIILYETNIRVPATLQLDPEGEKPAIQKEYTAYNVDFTEERVCFVKDRKQLELIFSPKKGPYS